MDNTELGDAIRQLRVTLGGISQERFARKLGTTVRTVARWEASESLSAPILSRLRSIALAAKARESAAFFEEKLREDLDWREGDDFETWATPGTNDEYQLVDEFLKRYRAEDPAFQPFVEQLWASMTKAEATLEQKINQAEAARLGRPTLRDQLLIESRRQAKEARKKETK